MYHISKKSNRQFILGKNLQVKTNLPVVLKYGCLRSHNDLDPNHGVPVFFVSLFFPVLTILVYECSQNDDMGVTEILDNR